MYSRIFLSAFLVFFANGRAASLAAQGSAPPTRPARQPSAVSRSAAAAASEPLRCWWKPDTSAVRVGELFGLVLTCRVFETDAEKVVFDEGLLDPAAFGAAPYEVMEGTRHRDTRAGVWRFVAYRYTLRIIGPDLFGKEVSIPALEIPFRVEQAVAGRERLTGQEKIYMLPAYPMRVESLVPKNANDIRDAARDTFGDVEQRRLRANVAFLVAALLLVAPAALAVPAMTAAARRRRGQVSERAIVQNPRIVRAIARELAAVQTARHAGGWTEKLVGRALTAFRIAGAVALSRPVTQLAAERNGAGRDGEITVRTGLLRPTVVRISSSITPEAMQDRLNGSSHDGHTDQESHERLANGFQEAFSILTRARYSSTESPTEAALDEALESGRQLVRRLRRQHLWGVRQLRASRTRAQSWRRSWIRP